MGVFGWLHFSPQSRRTGMPRPVGSGTGHAAVNLLPGHGAYTNTKENGTPMMAQDTSGAISSYSTRGDLLAAMGGLTLLPRASKPTAPGSSGSVTGDRGGSGAAPERADYH